MESRLRELNTVVGVHGSCVINVEGEIVAQVMPDSVSAENLAIAARLAAQTVEALATSGKRVTEIDLAYDHGRFILKNMKGGMLGIMCARNINLPLLQLNSNIAAKKISADLKANGNGRGPKGREAGLASKAIAIPDSSKERFQIPQAVIKHMDEARRLVELAESSGLVLRALGTVGVLSHCHSAHSWLVGHNPNPKLEFITSQADSAAILKCLRSAGCEPNQRLNMFYANRRLVFSSPLPGAQVHVFVNVFERNQRLDLASELVHESFSIAPTFLLLTRLQAHEMSQDELREVAALVLDHDLSLGRVADQVDELFIRGLCAEDWGWYRTVTQNLGELPASAKTWLSAEEVARLQTWADRLSTGVKEAPKSLRWQMRARLGDSVRWYQAAEEPGAFARPEMAFG